MANVTIVIPDAVLPTVRAAAVQRGFDADGDGTATNADVAAYTRDLLKRDVVRMESQRAGEGAASTAAAAIG